MVRQAISAATGANAAPEPLGRLLALNRMLVMGILNVTPDSFSDGGQFDEPGHALDHARRMVGEGADILDIGGESTRPYPGATPVELDEELARLAPVLPAVVGLGVPVSIDTMKAKVAEWAVARGAQIVNDVWGLQRDPDMARVVAEHRVPVIVMHNRHDVDPAIDIVADMDAFFKRSLEIAAKAGVAREAIVLDPGIGFGKTPEQSMTCIARLDALKSFGLPVLIGASRKRFIKMVSAAEPQQRLPGSLAAHLIAVENGAVIVRAHDVVETMQALTVAAAIRSTR
jgi:dihydropteroate synthase